jgi:hypothetical protein
VFSGIDQNGTVKSVQRFEGLVRRKFPSLSDFQSLDVPSEFLYGATTFFFNLTASTLKKYSSETAQNQISSELFFQLVSAPRPFSRSQVILFLTLKYLLATV